MTKTPVFAVGAEEDLNDLIKRYGPLRVSNSPADATQSGIPLVAYVPGMKRIHLVDLPDANSVGLGGEPDLISRPFLMPSWGHSYTYFY